MWIKRVFEFLGIDDYRVVSRDEALGIVLYFHIERIACEYDGEMDWL